MKGQRTAELIAMDRETAVTRVLMQNLNGVPEVVVYDGRVFVLWLAKFDLNLPIEWDRLVHGDDPIPYREADSLYLAGTGWPRSETP